MGGLGAARLLDLVRSICPKIPSGPILRASFTTFVNNRGLARQGDPTVPGPILSGSRSKFCDNRAIARMKDPVSCGRITTASTDTFIGD